MTDFSLSSREGVGDCVGDRVAILLCAGYATRMGDLTRDTPKPLLPISGKPILDYLVEPLLDLEGLAAVHVVSNARFASAFTGWCEAWNQRLGSRWLVLHNDGSTSNEDRLGAIGDLDFVLRRLGRVGGALVAAGDNIYQFSLRPFWEAFVRHDRSYVLGLHEPDLSKLRRTGVLELDAGDRVLELHEKPEDPPSEWACPSLYCLRGSALSRLASYLAAGGSSDEIGRFVGHLVKQEEVFCHRETGERLHVGSPEAYRRARKILEGV